MKFQATPWGVMPRAWTLPPVGVHHRANKTKKKARKAQRIARRQNRT